MMSNDELKRMKETVNKTKGKLMSELDSDLVKRLSLLCRPSEKRLVDMTDQEIDQFIAEFSRLQKDMNFMLQAANVARGEILDNMTEEKREKYIADDKRRKAAPKKEEKEKIQKPKKIAISTNGNHLRDLLALGF